MWAKEGKAEEAVKMLREMNANAAIITTPIEQLDGAKILERWNMWILWKSRC